MKRCLKCNEEKEENLFPFRIKNKNIRKSTCKKCLYSLNKEKQKLYYKTNKETIQQIQKLYIENNKEKIRQYNLSIKRKYSEYKRNSCKRNISFNLSIEEFNYLWKQPCYYCNKEISTIGIDRVDNLEGYNLKNCVSCCKECNFQKGYISIEMCKKIIKHINERI